MNLYDSNGNAILDTIKNSWIYLKHKYNNVQSTIDITANSV